MPGAKALSVLVIEDEVLISMLLEDMLDEAGCTIVGPCPSVDEAMSVLDGQAFDVALVDLGLADGTSEPVIRELAARSIPFAIMSGQTPPDDAGDTQTYLTKPFTFTDVKRTLGTLAAMRAGAADG
jgi:DNA-binding NtrC family response regulator